MVEAKFEYKVTGTLPESELNVLGSVGWELVSSDGGRMIFRRSKDTAEMPKRETFIPQRKK